MIRDIEQDDGVLIFDDTIQEKPYTDENDLICWHYDHSQNRTVKGINLLNCVYHASDVSLPVTYELITKPVLYTDVKTRRVKRKSLVTKNDLMRDMLSVCKRNRINIAMYWPIVGSLQRKTCSLFATAWISTSLSQ